MNNHTDFYSKAKFYDIAFKFKNVTEENQTILDIFVNIITEMLNHFWTLLPAQHRMQLRWQNVE